MHIQAYMESQRFGFQYMFQSLYEVYIYYKEGSISTLMVRTPTWYSRNLKNKSAAFFFIFPLLSFFLWARIDWLLTLLVFLVSSRVEEAELVLHAAVESHRRLHRLQGPFVLSNSSPPRPLFGCFSPHMKLSHIRTLEMD